MASKFSEGKPYKVIAFCLTKFNDYDQVKIMNQLCNHCAEHNIKIMVFTSATDLFNGGINDIGEGHIFSLFDVERFDAIVVMSETFKHSDVLNNLINRALRYEVPVISVDHAIHGCINITFDYGDAFEKIVRHVVEEHGVRNLGFIAGPKDNPFSEERIASYKHVLADNNINFNDTKFGYGDFWTDPTREVLESFLADQDGLPEAIICANDIMAIECIRVLRERGIKVPDQVIVTGFDGIELERYYSPRLTTAEFDVQALQQAIFQAVFDNTDGKKGQQTIHIEYRNRIGASCGCKDMSTENVEERLYTQKLMDDDHHIYIESMYNMIAKLSNYPDLHYIFKMVPEYFKKSNCTECWMCFNSDFLDENLDIRSSFNREEDDYSKYTETMRVPMHSIEQMVFGEEDFNTNDLLPNIERVLSNHNYFMFVPVHLQGFTVGYIGNAFDVDKFKFAYFQAFLLNFRHILEIYVNRSTQARLYVCDVLTHIYNRHGFYRNIGEILKNSYKKQIPFTVISIDMDGLKGINDSYGHAEGDFAIKTMAECMMLSTNKMEICSRFGGDEFVIAFSCQNSDARAKEIIESIKSKLEIFNSLGNKPYSVGASFGYFTKIAEKTETLDDFIKYADAYMYENKQARKKARLLLEER